MTGLQRAPLDDTKILHECIMTRDTPKRCRDSFAHSKVCAPERCPGTQAVSLVSMLNRLAVMPSDVQVYRLKNDNCIVCGHTRCSNTPIKQLVCQHTVTAACRLGLIRHRSDRSDRYCRFTDTTLLLYNSA